MTPKLTVGNDGCRPAWRVHLYRSASRSLATLALAAVALVTTSCDGNLLVPTLETTRDLAAARAKWNAQRITDYEYTLQRICFCADTRPMRVVVRGGLVQSVRPEGELLPQSVAIDYWINVADDEITYLASDIRLP